MKYFLEPSGINEIQELLQVTKKILSQSPTTKYQTKGKELYYVF